MNNFWQAVVTAYGSAYFRYWVIASAAGTWVSRTFITQIVGWELTPFTYPFIETVYLLLYGL